MNTFAPSLDTLAARLRRKYGAGQKLPIGRYVEEHDVGQRLHRNAHKSWRGDVSGGGGGIFEPRNIRSHIASWFASAGRLLQRMPTLRRHIDEPSVVLVRNVSFVWPRSSSNPELVAHTLPRSGPVISAQPRDLRRANTYAGRGRGDENNDHTSEGNEIVGPYMTEMSGDTFAKSASTNKLNV
ncbi:unnamed protein product [Hymenolepis diminuta]|uniref:Uncharacterized protein n=1 Tax=Hymenolepis diminuta TaxID=6216 RepID=A0A3P7A4U9_HYMDI|nr:unnamed protein product [Hymenolepis diminuta]